MGQSEQRAKPDLLMSRPSLAQEGANINKSLTTLGKVISALAEMVSWRRGRPGYLPVLLL